MPGHDDTCCCDGCTPTSVHATAECARCGGTGWIGGTLMACQDPDCSTVKDAQHRAALIDDAQSHYDAAQREVREYNRLMRELDLPRTAEVRVM